MCVVCRFNSPDVLIAVYSRRQDVYLYAGYYEVLIEQPLDNMEPIHVDFELSFGTYVSVTLTPQFTTYAYDCAVRDSDKAALLTLMPNPFQSLPCSILPTSPTCGVVWKTITVSLSYSHQGSR